jgi:elongator complex protein 3
MDVCRELHSPTIPANTDLLERVPARFLSRLKPLLTEKRVRGISGVTIIALMPKPWACPHGKCTYCPGGPEIGVPRAYTGKEPVAMRAKESEYDPTRQVNSRLSQLKAMGHVPDKIELIVVGGTFSFLPEDYQESFIKNCLDALNGVDSLTLDDAKILAEKAKSRNVGITVETRPDWSRRPHVDHMLSLGVTRVEIGVQTLYDDVYQRIHREHTVKDVIDATQTLKDSALKVGYHMMPGLPGSNHDRDLEAFRRIFEDPDFKPDMLKIYPCLVTPGTQLYEQWQRGEYKPYSTEESAKLIAEAKMFVPPWVRIMRIQREIPAYNIADGVKKGNLRQLVEAELEKRGGRCRCIRCREAGHANLKNRSWPNMEQVRLNRITYEGSGGEDLFLSYEDPSQDMLIGYLRLRIPGPASHRPEILGQHAGLVREVHVFGQTVAVGERMEAAFQHKGFGSGLLMEAERIAVEEYDCRKMVIISALGTKGYYARFGYAKDGPYVSKQIFAS